jgi:hypothetical protein
MAKETHDSLHKRIEALKAERGQRWRDLLPDDVNSDPERANRLAREAERHPDVLAYDEQMRELRSRQQTLTQEN